MKKSALFALLTLIFAHSSQAEWESQIGIELQAFTESTASAGPNANATNENMSVSFESEFHQVVGESELQLTLIPFLRWDYSDTARNHVDLREAHVLKAVDQWVFQAGLGKVFWGVTESNHLVDIINQTDSLEGFDGEDKLGQPLLRLGYELDQGAIDVYLLPGFRQREYLSTGQRFSAPMPLSHQALFESEQGQDHVDFALRWGGYRGPVDFGLSYFKGTARAPEFVPINKTNSLFAAYYPQIKQTGLELQYTGDVWLWKLEAIHRQSTKTNYTAATGGFEYTFYGLKDGLLDLGVLTEYHWDSRNDTTRVVLQNDVFVGARFAFNDAQSSSILAGSLIDLDDDTTSIRLEGSRRIGDNYTLELETQFFSNAQTNNIAQGFAQNDFIKLEIKRYF